MGRVPGRTVQTTLLLWLGLALASCGTSEPPYLAYRAYQTAFDKSTVAEAERHLREVGSRWDLIVHEQRRTVFDSAGVFTTFMFRDKRAYERQRWIVVAGNYVGTDDDVNRSSLTLHFYDNGDMPVDELDRLAFEIKHTMQDRFGLEFCRVNPARSLCDEEYARLEEAREARLGGGGPR